MPRPCLIGLDQREYFAIAANDYIIAEDGIPHLLEVNHIPNVTRFPEIWEGYVEYVAEWLGGLAKS